MTQDVIPFLLAFSTILPLLCINWCCQRRRRENARLANLHDSLENEYDFGGRYDPIPSGSNRYDPIPIPDFYNSEDLDHVTKGPAKNSNLNSYGSNQSANVFVHQDLESYNYNSKSTVTTPSTRSGFFSAMSRFFTFGSTVTSSHIDNKSSEVVNSQPAPISNGLFAAIDHYDSLGESESNLSSLESDRTGGTSSNANTKNESPVPLQEDLDESETSGLITYNDGMHNQINNLDLCHESDESHSGNLYSSCDQVESSVESSSANTV